ncbi:mitochondrial tRNA methylthiotransferase CDK5RAP1-like isoform X2 [Tubulanus polymorphus]
MNVNDTEIAWSILEKSGFHRTLNINDSDVILVMTCAIREGAEQKIWKRLQFLKSLKKRRQQSKKKSELKIGILGCMAERLKTKILEKEKMVDLVCGPDAYRDLPRMLSITQSGQTAVNVLLSLEETYADVMPVRLNENSRTAFVSIMRGCDNMCSYCIVPFTRGRERSRPIDSIIDEVKQLSDQGIKEVTLLGQNVNSYRDTSVSESFNVTNSDQTHLSKGFRTIYKTKKGGRRFSDLLDCVSRVDPEMRIRFTSPHPKDFPDEVLFLIKERQNICNQIHLPAQSGNNEVLDAMRRGYTREAYVQLVKNIRNILPDVSLSSDFISGFCGETEEAHQETVDLIKLVKYNFAFCFPYSMRGKTHAYHKLSDDVPQDVKNRRFMELINVFRDNATIVNQRQIGQVQLVLIEGDSKRSIEDFAGRNDANTKVIFQKKTIPSLENCDEFKPMKPGDYVAVQIIDGTSQVLRGIPLYHTSIRDFHRRTESR